MLIKPDLNKPAFRIFPDAKERIENNKCPICTKEIKEEDFNDELSKSEYTVSGLCQSCQNKTFGSGQQ